MPDLKELFEIAAGVVEAAGVGLLLIGMSLALGRFLLTISRATDRPLAYGEFRQRLGRTLMITLEFLIGSDIIYSVAVDRSLQSLLMLGGLVVIRTFLSFSLELELTGRWPWQAGEGERANPNA